LEGRDNNVETLVTTFSVRRCMFYEDINFYK